MADGFFSPGYFASASVDDVRFRLGNGDSLVATDGSGDTVLHRAAADSHNLEVINLLLEHIQLGHVKLSYSIYVDSPNCKFMTPLHEAASKNWDEKIAEAFLKADADINARANTLETPLHKAVAADQELAVIQILLKWNPDLEALDTREWTPLHKAASISSKIKVVDMLLEAGARKDAETDQGETPCQIARDAGAPEEIRNRLCT